MDGIRTVKTNGSTIHHYTLNGSQIVTETWTTKSSSGAETPNHFLVYLYDENGAPIGLQYRNKTYGTYTFDTYYFEKNLQGDIVAIYTEEGTKKGLRNRVLNRRLFLCRDIFALNKIECILISENLIPCAAEVVTQDLGSNTQAKIPAMGFFLVG